MTMFLSKQFPDFLQEGMALRDAMHEAIGVPLEPRDKVGSVLVAGFVP